MDEENETYDKIVQLKITAADGKKRMMDVTNLEEFLLQNYVKNTHRYSKDCVIKDVSSYEERK